MANSGSAIWRRTAVFWRFLIAGAYSAGVFLASSRSTPPVPFIPDLDKAFHFFTYVGLGLTYVYAATAGLREHTRARLMLAWTAAVLFAISDEWRQSFVPGRTPELTDLLADALGISAAIALGAWLSRSRR